MTLAGRLMTLVTMETAILDCLPRLTTCSCATIDALGVNLARSLGVAAALEHDRITILEPVADNQWK
jgi:hypothetical protein